MAKLGLVVAAILALVSVFTWRAYLQATSDPSYEEDPTAWAGAPGSTAGPEGFVTLPALEDRARSDLRTATALGDLPGLELAALRQRLGEPDVLQAGEGRAHGMAIWHSAVTLEELPLDGHPVAHLKLVLRKPDRGSSLAGARVERVDLIGSFGEVVSTRSGPEDGASEDDATARP